MSATRGSIRKVGGGSQNVPSSMTGCGTVPGPPKSGSA